MKPAPGGIGWLRHCLYIPIKLKFGVKEHTIRSLSHVTMTDERVVSCQFCIATRR